MEHPNQEIMQAAIGEARKALADGQYALGAVVVSESGEVISIAHTTLHLVNDPTAHAETNAIREAAKIRESRYLENCWLYTTLEPCPMCTSAAIWAKVKGIVFGANKDDAMEQFEKSAEAKFTWRQIDISARDIISKGTPILTLHENFMHEECKKLIT